MKKLLACSALITAFALTASSFGKEAIRKTASNGCTIAQVMRTVRQAKSAYSHFEYGSDYNGRQGPPTQKQNENNDQYLFWIDDNGNSCPAVVTYESGQCTGGTGVVKMNDCQ